MFTFVYSRRVRTLAGLALLACSATPSFVSAQTIINFDDVVDGTDIRTHYDPQGVTFSCEGAKCAIPQTANGIFARTTTPTASTPNSVSSLQTGVPGFMEGSQGRVVATFASPAQSVSIDARTLQVPEPLNQRHYATITAFDATGAVVASTVGMTFNAFETLTVSAADNRIVKVALGVSGVSSVANFDNLQFSFAPHDDSKLAVMIKAAFAALVLSAAYWFFRRRKPR